jgi:hypothetical protein
MWRGLMVLAGLVVCAGGALPCAAAPVKADWQVSGKFADDTDLPRMKEAPKDGVIVNAKAFAKLWQAWRGKEAPPKVDFDKQLVLVGTTTCAANRLFVAPQLEGGNLRVAFGATRIAGPGFAYLIVALPRTGVKTVNGKALGKE